VRADKQIMPQAIFFFMSDIISLQKKRSFFILLAPPDLLPT